MVKICVGYVLLLALILTTSCSAIRPNENNAGGGGDEQQYTGLLRFTGGRPINPGDTIILNIREVQLKDAWTLSTQNVTIQGLEGSKTVITCAASKNALAIWAPGARISNIIFKNCKSTGAVLIKNPRNLDPVVDAKFHNVEFHGNEIEDHSQNYGAAIFVGDDCSASVNGSIFANNVAPAGGAIYVSIRGSLWVEECSFESNVGKFFGGGAILSSGRLSVISSTFSNCQSLGSYDNFSPSGPLGRPREAVIWYNFPEPGSSGGAIFVNGGRVARISRSSFKSNMAAAGGALSAFYNVGEADRHQAHVFEVENCTFEGNTAFTDDEWIDADVQLGGAIHLSVFNADIEPVITKSSFENNSARFGGALHVVTQDETPVEIAQCHFQSNHAELGGGAVVLRNTGRTTWTGNEVIGNFAGIGGGLLLTNNAFLIGVGQARGDDGEPVSGKASLFENNTAIDGGAIACVLCGSTLFQDPIFRNNLAGRNGGGMSIENAVSEVFLQHVTATGNTALRGGGIYVDSVPHFRISGGRRGTVESVNKFKKNKASVGGGLYVSAENRQSNTILISQVRFVNNEAAPMAVLSNALSGAYDTLQKSKPDNSNYVSEESCGNGGGGGMCLLLDSIPKTASADVVLSKLYFAGNTAMIGGGLFARIGKPWNIVEAMNIYGCPANPLLGEDPCRQVSLLEATFRDNSATEYPALFVSNPASIPVACTSDDEFTILKDVIGLPESATTIERACVTMKGNKLKVGKLFKMN